MAEVKENYIVQGTSGRIGKLMVNKIINGKTFITKYPDRSNVNYTKEQIEFRKIFAKAAKFASEIVRDPAKKSTYPRQGRKSIYHCALSDYMTDYKRKKADNLSADAD
ncbi:MAG: hypothetical protein M3N30_11115 [Bacteroidota bacterium]|nr:hypothetical protein [Bacteroidota bacterium]